MAKGCFSLMVREVRSEIGGQATSIVFDMPTHLRDVFNWHPGQHLALRLMIHGKEVWRSYSISSSPMSGEPLRITVKRVPGGLASNYLNDHLKAGDRLDVRPPSGGFILQPDGLSRRTHYFFCAGSGITPILSMLRSVLEAEPYSTAYLVYGNKDMDSILFRAELNDLQKKHSSRCYIAHVLSNGSWWKKKMIGLWRNGKIDREAVHAFISENPPYAQDCHYYICGPGTMNESIAASLKEIDVPENRIHSESYGGLGVTKPIAKGVACTATVTIEGEAHKVSIAAGQTILDAIRKSDLPLPYSCQSGICGSCKVTLKSGNVDMAMRTALSDAEVQQGSILVCQSVSTSDTLTIVC